MEANEQSRWVVSIADGQQIGGRFREMLESMPDGILMVDPGGNILVANACAGRLFGYEPAELPGMAIEVLLPARLREGHRAHRTGFFAHPRVRPMGAGIELFGLRKDGSEFPVEISLGPLATEIGTVVLAAVRDITERKRFEMALQEKNVQLIEASRAKDRFLAAMSHELRTPLNAVIGFAGTLLMGLPGPLNEEQQRQMQIVRANARHLLALINDLLDVAKIEAGKLELHPTATEVTAIVREVVDSLRPAAQTKGIELMMTIPESEITISTDRRLLKQILLNLANNAIKFTEHGRVVVRLSVDHSQPRRKLIFCVDDTGPGIRDEDQAVLFEAFMQGHASHRVGAEGTGLGLHLSRKLAVLLGGELTFRSQFGRGSSFCLNLPEP